MSSTKKNTYGDWALVAGATTGIGAELTSQLAAKGYNLVLIARRENDLKEQASSLKTRYGVEVSYVSADLTTQEGINKVTQIKEEIGLLVISAGIEVNGSFWKTAIEKEIATVQLNVMAPLQLTHHFCKGMVDRKKGGILLVASLSGHMPNPYFSNYAGTKAYILNFGASLYGELKPKGVDISVLSPGLTNTGMIQDNGMDWSKTPMTAMEPSEVAEIALSNLGKQFLIVPGFKNKMMAGMAKHSPLEMQAKMNEKMVRKAISPAKI